MMTREEYIPYALNSGQRRREVLEDNTKVISVYDMAMTVSGAL